MCDFFFVSFAFLLFFFNAPVTLRGFTAPDCWFEKAARVGTLAACLFLDGDLRKKEKKRDSETVSEREREKEPLWYRLRKMNTVSLKRRRDEVEREPEWLMRRGGEERGGGGGGGRARRQVGGLAAALARSGEVHGVLGVIVDLDRLGQSLRVPAVALTRHVAALGAAGRRQREFSN